MTLTEIFPTAPAGATCVVPMLRKNITWFSSIWKWILNIRFKWSVMLFTLCSWSWEGNSSSDTKLDWSEGNSFCLAASGLKNLKGCRLGYTTLSPSHTASSCSCTYQAKWQVSTSQPICVTIWYRCCIATRSTQHLFWRWFFFTHLQQSSSTATELHWGSDSGYRLRLAETGTNGGPGPTTAHRWGFAIRDSTTLTHSLHIHSSRYGAVLRNKVLTPRYGVVGTVSFGRRLDLIISKRFFNFNDSMISVFSGWSATWSGEYCVLGRQCGARGATDSTACAGRATPGTTRRDGGAGMPSGIRPEGLSPAAYL